jgi:hypothetical protein
MGFNKRKMEDERRRAAEKEAANRRATDGQVLEDCGAPNRGPERAPSQANADAVLADDWCRDCSWLLVPVGALPSLPNDQRPRSAHTRPPS